MPYPLRLTDTDGIFMIVGRQSCDTRKLEGSIDVGNSQYGGMEALVVFDILVQMTESSSMVNMNMPVFW